MSAAASSVTTVLPQGRARAEGAGLPGIAQGARRAWLLQLLALGLLQAALGGVCAWALVKLMEAPQGTSPLLLRAVLVLVLAALAIGALRIHERVIAEKLGQHYVHQVRVSLLEAALAPGRATPADLAAARTVDDLASIRTWVSQGAAPLVVTGPLLSGTLGVLAGLDWRLAAAMAVPLAVLGLCLWRWSRATLPTSRRLRDCSGRLDARLTDVVAGSDGVLTAGRAERELRDLVEESHAVRETAVQRAEKAGTIRAGGIVAATLTILLVAATGTYVGLDAGITVAAMAVASIAGASMLELGRIVEYRQDHLAATTALAPVLARTRAPEPEVRDRREASAALAIPDQGPEGDLVAHLDLPGLTDPGAPVRLHPGDKVRLVSTDPAAPSAFVRRLMELDSASHDTPDSVWVSGENLRAVPAERLPELVGHAAAGARFGEGTVADAVCAARSGGDLSVLEALQDVGLDPATLPGGVGTQLSAGGRPLDTAQRARLALARAVHGAPPLLVVDGLERDLDREGRDALADALLRYEGAVVLTGTSNLAARVGAVDHRLLDPEAGRDATRVR